jgi:hypothetical protein
MDSGDLSLTPTLLADLDAGLLDDATAARVRRQAAADPDAVHLLAALAAVRRELRRLGEDDRGAPAVPPDITERVVTALRGPADTATGNTRAYPGVQRKQAERHS